MATLAEVANYTLQIYEAQSVYADKVVLKEKLGHRDVYCNRVKLVILNNYVKLMADYFDDFITAGVDNHSYDTNNFFTTDEVQDVVDRINLLCDSNYTLDL